MQMSDLVWMFLGLVLAISFAGDRITYAIVGRPGGAMKPWATMISRVIVGALGAIPGFLLGNIYIAGAGGFLGIEIGPAVIHVTFPVPKPKP